MWNGMPFRLLFHATHFIVVYLHAQIEILSKLTMENPNDITQAQEQSLPLLPPM